MLISVSFGEVFSYLHSHSDTKLGGLVIWKEDAHTSRHFPQKWNKYAEYWAENVPFPQHNPWQVLLLLHPKKDAILAIIPYLGLGIINWWVGMNMFVTHSRWFTGFILHDDIIDICFLCRVVGWGSLGSWNSTSMTKSVNITALWFMCHPSTTASYCFTLFYHFLFLYSTGCHYIMRE